MVKELATKDKILKGEVDARREHELKKKAMEKELHQLRSFKAQFLTLAASLKGAGNTD